MSRSEKFYRYLLHCKTPQVIDILLINVHTIEVRSTLLIGSSYKKSVIIANIKKTNVAIPPQLSTIIDQKSRKKIQPKPGTESLLKGAHIVTVL